VIKAPSEGILLSWLSW